MTEMTALHAPLRIAGIQIRTPLAQVHAALNDLWTRWQNDKSARLPSFTPTVYCVYRYFDDAPDEVQITLGRIVANDLMLPAFTRETVLPVQSYACYAVADRQPETLFGTWRQIESDAALPRSFTADFETHPIDRMPRIYVGIQAA